MKLGIKSHGAAHRSFKTRVKELNLNTDHFIGQAHLRGKTHGWAPKQPLDQILVEDSKYANSTCLKRRLIKSNLLQYKCYRCNIDTWCNELITLQLDHINGINNDNRIENLRLLCPNCHSLTPTFAGKNTFRIVGL